MISRDAALDGLSFGSFGEATRTVLELLERRLPSSVVWVGQFDRERGLLRVLDARGIAAIDIQPGLEVPLEGSLCEVMASGRGDRLVADAAGDPVYGSLAVREALDVGSFVGVPLELSDGKAAGTLCAVARDMDAYTAADLDLLGVLSRLLAHEIEREHRETALLELTRSLGDEARTDPLTGLLNRRAFDQALSREWERAQSAAGESWVAVGDLDDLKGLNDRRGHAAGDAALRAIGAVMRDLATQGDVAARLSGDEFALLLPGRPDAGAVRAHCRRINRALAEQTADAPQLSFGFAALGEAPSCASALARADRIMYHEKHDRTADRGPVGPEPAVPPIA